MLGVDGTQWRWYSAERCSRLAPRSYAGRYEPVSVLLVSINERHKNIGLLTSCARCFLNALSHSQRTCGCLRAYWIDER